MILRRVLGPACGSNPISATFALKPDRIAMDENEDKEHSGVLRLASVDDVEVRATMDATRQVLEASTAEIARSKRLLRETEELIEPIAPASSAEGQSD